MSTPPIERENRSPSPFIQAMNPDQRREHMRLLGQRSAANRLTLNRDEREALGAAYELLGRIAARHNLDTSPDEAA